MWTPPDMDQTSSTQAAIAPKPTMQDDFQSQYNSMLAPYQERAQRIFGGDPVFGNSSFVQNHPTASHVMSNLLLAASKAQPGMTPADSIRIAATMAMAPEQARRQQQMNLAMAPGQMMSPEMALLQHLSLMRQQNAMSQQHLAMADYYTGAKTDLATAQAARAGAPKTHFGTPVMDPNNPQGMLQPEYDSATGKQVGMVPIAGMPQPKGGVGNPNRDFTQSGILRRMADPDPAVRAEAETDRDKFIQMSSGLAGGKTGAEQAAPHPQANVQALISQTHSSLMKDIPPAEPVATWAAKAQDADVFSGKDITKQDYNKRYQTEVSEPWQQKLQDRLDNFNKWRQTDAKQEIPFDPKKKYSSSPTQSAPSNSGSNWQPK